MQERLQMFRELTEAPGAPGFERKARDVMRTYIEPYADEISYDNLGSLIAKKTGVADGPKILVAGHLDEVAFMVTRITDEGFIKFQTLGGWYAPVVLAQRVQVQTRTGMIDGIIGSVPPHLMSVEARRKLLEFKDMFIDVGATCKKDVEEFGIRPGDPILPFCPFTQMQNPKMWMGKAFDNRVGCAAAIDLLKSLQGEAHPNTVYSVGTVQEEVGTRGAKTVTNKIKPDMAIVVDVGIPGDTPGVSKNQAEGKLGGGIEFGLYDAGMITNPSLLDFAVSVANEWNIPYTFSSVPGGSTDAAPIHTTASGIPSLTVGIGVRYIHSHAGIMNHDDYDQLIRFLTEFTKQLDADKVAEFCRY